LDIGGQLGQPAAGLKQPHGRQLLAQEGGHDGFYYAKLIKIAAARG
jgi:16S rRNA (cytosine967-C5)-methyltransferase